MEAEEIITKISKARKLEDVLNPSNLKDEYNAMMKKIHPDVCKSVYASSASSKLNELKQKYEGGTEYLDEAGPFKTNGYTATYKGDHKLLDTSLLNYNKLMSYKDAAAKNFQKYLPTSILKTGTTLESKFTVRSVPLAGLEEPLPMKHVNWILSRMIEFCVWMENIDMVHGGLNPESIFIMPENHGIQVGSFYMMSQAGKKINGISGKYKTWYPPQLFKDKLATHQVDLELCMKTAIYLLGDKSGTGIKLKKDSDINQEVLDFMIKQHDNPSECFAQYRKLLDRTFKKEFHILDV